MMVRVLGCSGSIAARCYTTAFLVDQDILLDAGSGVGELRLDELARIDDVFISHSHLDHVLALPLMADSVIRMRMRGGPLKPIRVHALPATLEAIRKHVFNGVLWPDFTRLPTPEHPVITLHPIEIGQTIELPRPPLDAANGPQPPRLLHVLPAAHTVPACGFALEGPRGWWIYTGDTGPNPALWRVLADKPIAHLIIETAFGDDERELAAISGHLAPASLAAELTQLDGSVSVHITHTKPGEMAAVLGQIRALDTQHQIEPLRVGQLFSF